MATGNKEIRETWSIVRVIVRETPNITEEYKRYRDEEINQPFWSEIWYEALQLATHDSYSDAARACGCGVDRIKSRFRELRKKPYWTERFIAWLSQDDMESVSTLIPLLGLNRWPHLGKLFQSQDVTSYYTLKRLVLHPDVAELLSFKFEQARRTGTQETHAYLLTEAEGRMHPDEFSVRAYNCLWKANIRTYQDLASKSAQDLLRLRNFGQKCLQEVKTKLAAMDLRLAEESEQKEE